MHRIEEELTRHNGFLLKLRFQRGPSKTTFAELLAKLALEVFNVPVSCFALVVEPGMGGTSALEDCGFLGVGAPLLFSWGLYGRMPDSGFWFAEFYKALAHRAVGGGHMGNSHMFHMEVILAWHLSAFMHAFMHNA